jgi:hypothetical protein
VGDTNPDQPLGSAEGLAAGLNAFREEMERDPSGGSAEELEHFKERIESAIDVTAAELEDRPND